MTLIPTFIIKLRFPTNVSISTVMIVDILIVSIPTQLYYLITYCVKIRSTSIRIVSRMGERGFKALPNKSITFEWRGTMLKHSVFYRESYWQQKLFVTISIVSL